MRSQQKGFNDDIYLFILRMPNSFKQSNISENFTSSQIDSDWQQTFHEDKCKMFPNNCIGLLQIIVQKKIVSYATAFLIGPDLALTCAHNIPKEINQVNVQLILFVGHSGEIIKENRVKVSNYRSDQRFEKFKYEENYQRYDYSLLRLQRRIKREKYLRIAVDFQAEYQKNISIIGYPGQKLIKYKDTSKQEIYQYGSRGKIDQISKILIKHNTKTGTGQSGSPIMICKGEETYVIGIHQSRNQKISKSMGVLLTSEIAKNLLDWEKQMRETVFELVTIKNGETKVLSINEIKQQSRRQVERLKNQFQMRQKAHKCLTKSKQSGDILQTIRSTNQFIFDWDCTLGNSNIFKFFDLPSNGNDYYYVEGTKVIRNKQKPLYNQQILSLNPLPLKGSCKMTAKLINNESTLFFGLITEDRKHERWSGWEGKDHQRSVAYETYRHKGVNKAFINIDGAKSDFDVPPIIEGESVTLHVDCITQQLIWIVKDKVISHRLTDNFRQKKLYVFVAMNCQGTSIEMI